MNKKDNFYLLIISFILMMFKVGESSLISTSSLVAPFLYNKDLIMNDLIMDITRILYRFDAFLALIGVVLFFYSSISLLLKIFAKDQL